MAEYSFLKALGFFASIEARSMPVPDSRHTIGLAMESRMRNWIPICVLALLPSAALAQTFHAAKSEAIGCKNPAAAFLLYSQRDEQTRDPVAFRQVYEAGRCSTISKNQGWTSERNFGHTTLMHLNGGSTRLYFAREAMISDNDANPTAGTTDDGPDVP